MIKQDFPINDFQKFRIETFKERLKRREIWINGNLDDSIVELLYVNFIDLDSQADALPITIVINSNGGLFYEALVATDIIGTARCPVKTIALANASSGAFSLFMSGQDRICHDYSCLMMHAASFGIVDKLPHIEDKLKYVKYSQEKLARLFSYQTGGKTSPKYWLSIFESGKDKWFSIEEALKLGVVHRVVKRKEMIDPSFSIREPYTWDIIDFNRAQQV